MAAVPADACPGCGVTLHSGEAHTVAGDVHLPDAFCVGAGPCVDGALSSVVWERKSTIAVPLLVH
jgi:hypothetical protein